MRGQAVGQDNRSRDQKRKAKLAKKAERQSQSDRITPYEGKKYQAPEWVPHVSETELAIYETIKLSNRTLKNEQVRTVFITLIKSLRTGEPALLPEDAPVVSYAPGNEVDYLIWNIRRHWRLLVAKVGPVSPDDLIGILRTLLYSIEAHAWNTGSHRGYVAFLEGFLEQ
jgi:hypothetical protein